MGGGSWSSSDWTTYASTTLRSKATVDALYTSKTVHDVELADLDPKKISLRESCDSPSNPKSTPIITALDVTGSMSPVLDSMARKGLPTLAEELLNRGVVSNPHLLFMAVGDVEYDRCPLQVTQFEADNRIVEQLTKFYLECGGGGNAHESYTLPWYFAAKRTSIDCIKRGKKGYLFTVGDEEPNMTLSKHNLERHLGGQIEKDYTAQELLDMVSKMYHVFHVVVEQGSHARYALNTVMKKWRDILGQNVLPISDHTNLAEVIISAISLIEGVSDKETIINSWSGDTSIVVARAMDGLVVSSHDASSGVVRL